jgi:hypothetical protein
MPKTLREQIENNLMFFFLATLIAGFLAGVGAYRTILEIAQLETVSRRDLQELRSQNDSPPSLQTKVGSTKRSKKTLLPCSLRTAPNVTPTNVEAVISTIQGELKVRALSAIESGKPISQTPPGTYSYIPGGLLSILPETSTMLLEKQGVQRRYEKSRDYELIKLEPDSIFVIAFAGSSEAANAAVLDGTTPRRLTLFPWPSLEVSTLLVIPFERIMESSSRYIEPDTSGSILVLDVVLN